jgi:hypothetical protein
VRSGRLSIRYFLLVLLDLKRKETLQMPPLYLHPACIGERDGGEHDVGLRSPFAEKHYDGVVDVLDPDRLQ